MFLHVKNIDKLPDLQKDKDINHIIVIDHKGTLAKNPLSTDDYEVIRLNMTPKNNKKGNENK